MMAQNLHRLFLDAGDIASGDAHLLSDLSLGHGVFAIEAIAEDEDFPLSGGKAVLHALVELLALQFEPHHVLDVIIAF